LTWRGERSFERDPLFSVFAITNLVSKSGIVDIFLGGKIARVCLSENREENRGENREESVSGALLRALHAPDGADEERIARGCPACMCTAP